MPQCTSAASFWRVPGLLVLVSTILLLSSQPALAHFTEQWRLIVPEGGRGGVSLSGDGNTAIVGASDDNGGVGAAWVFTRSGGQWSQQQKLVGTTATEAASQGISVALSADGTTAIVGGPDDNRGIGAAWVFAHSGGQWTQQQKLVGADADGAASQGSSVALSADGNTAIVGGANDNAQTGAAWVFTRSGDTWNQEGKKLVGTNAIGPALQGYSVSLSGDGNTAIIGGPGDGAGAAAWVFTRHRGQWTQQGKKLIGTGAVADPGQGGTVALSGDGNTAIIGGAGDGWSGAWVFSRSGGQWTEQSQLATDGDEHIAVALSSDGNTAIVGTMSDNSFEGAAWVFARTGGKWKHQGQKLVGTSGHPGDDNQGRAVALSADGNTAIVGGRADPDAAAWVYVKFRGPEPATGLAIDPMALIFKGKWLDVWYEFKHPHEPKVAEIQQVLRSMTPEEQEATVDRARILVKYGKTVEDAFAGMRQ